MAVNNIIKRIRNIMRQDAGINGDAQRIEQMTWMIFLKVYDNIIRFQGTLHVPITLVVFVYILLTFLFLSLLQLQELLQGNLG